MFSNKYSIICMNTTHRSDVGANIRMLPRVLTSIMYDWGTTTWVAIQRGATGERGILKDRIDGGGGVTGNLWGCRGACPAGWVGRSRVWQRRRAAESAQSGMHARGGHWGCTAQARFSLLPMDENSHALSGRDNHLNETELWRRNRRVKNIVLWCRRIPAPPPASHPSSLPVPRRPGKKSEGGGGCSNH
jgi:hypothetical protein